MGCWDFFGSVFQSIAILMGYINQASESVFLQAGCYPEDTFKTQIQTRKGDKFSGKMALSKNVVPRHPKNLVGGLEHEFCFSICWECHHPN